MLSQDTGRYDLKQVGFWHFTQTPLDYYGKVVTIDRLDILQRHVWLSSGEMLTFDAVVKLHPYQEIRYS